MAGFVWYVALLAPFTATGWVFGEPDVRDFLSPPLVSISFALSTLAASLMLMPWIRRRHHLLIWMFGAIVMVFLVAIISASFLFIFSLCAIGKPQLSITLSYIRDLLGTIAFLLLALFGVVALSLHVALPLALGQLWMLRKIIKTPPTPVQPI